MGLLADLITEKRSTIDFSNLKNPANWLISSTGGAPTTAGVSVSPSSSMTLTAVYASVKIIAWTIASLPLVTYRRIDPRGKERATDLEIYSLLHDAPNSEQTSFEWRALMSVHQNLFGAGISEIEYDATGKIMALWPIPPWCAAPMRTATGELIYEVNVKPRNGLPGATRYLWPWEVVVFPALSTSRDYWLSPIGQHRETVGAAMAAKEFGAKTFGQGTNPGGILSGLKFPNEVSEESIRRKFSEGYSGIGNSHRLMLLEEGVKFERIGIPPEDAQYLETRKFDIAEIARIYSVPLHLLQEVTGTTSWGSGIEELNSAFLQYTLRPYLVQSEQELNRRLLGNSPEIFIEHLIEGMLRAKLADRIASYTAGRNGGWLSANDIRDLENQNPLPGDQGDVYLVPLNTQNAEKMVDNEDENDDSAAASAEEEPKTTEEGE
jgi:HK97 family phage portal protein